MKRKVQCQIVITTLPNARQAKSLARRLVESRLAACVQVAPIHSVYRWKQAVETAAEYRLDAKTATARVPALIAFIRRNHPYELPEIINHPISSGTPEYLRWIAEESGPLP
jgi:periplasmic divalent cation tolerance protein